MKKTVLLVNSDLEYGGAQRQIVELANYMDPNEFKTYVCSLSDYVPLADKLINKKDRLVIIKRRFRFDFSVVFRLSKLIRKLQADIVHSYLFDATIASRLASYLAPRPVIIGSERNTEYVIKKKDFMWLMMTRGLSDLTIANSNSGAKFNSKIFKQELNRYRVVHNGVDTKRFHPADGSKIRAKLGLSDKDPIVGMFASFKSQKNHPLLLRAVRHIIMWVPETRFLFVGDELYEGGSDSVGYKKEINQLVDDYGLKKHCLFIGNIDDVENYYPVCDLTVLPSFFEGTPNVALESMSCGVPVVATDVSDNSYVIPDGRTGYIVPLGDEKILAERVCQLLLQRDLRMKLSLKARSWVVQEFSCERLAEKTSIVYREALRFKRENMQ